MHAIRAELTAHCLAPSGRAAIRVRTPAGRAGVPGQPWLAAVPAGGSGFRQALYPVRLRTDGFEAEVARAEAWPLGSSLDLLGPLGPGFRPPRHAQRWLLASLRGDISRLLPLLEDGLQHSCAVAVWGGDRASHLPAAVEVLPTLADGLGWADYIALDADPESLHRWLDASAGGLPGLNRLAAEILLDLPMLCGFGGCLACSVSLRAGWKLACKDGPVFPLAEVLA
jgi:dihydroorotate dehydrogenase electron transfer subunit